MQFEIKQMMNLIRWQSIQVETPASPWWCFTRSQEGAGVKATELVVGQHGSNGGDRMAPSH